MTSMETRNVHDFIQSASALSSPSLDLSGKRISELPESIPGCSKLEVGRVAIYQAFVLLHRAVTYTVENTMLLKPAGIPAPIAEVHMTSQGKNYKTLNGCFSNVTQA